MRRSVPCEIAVFASALLLAGPAGAQSMSTNAAAYNAGWGRVAGQENRAVDPSTRDPNGNQQVIDGMIVNGNSQNVFANGAASAFAGVGVGASSSTGGATAIGNNLTVITQGSNNVVVVDSTQTNSGAVTATAGASVSGNGS